MTKNIYICEFCGCLSTQYFSQCKHCETHEDGSRYKFYKKEQINKINTQELLQHINKINEFVKSDGNIKETKMDKEIVDKEINKTKEEFDIIINNLEDKFDKKFLKINSFEQKISNDLSNLNDELIDLSQKINEQNYNNKKDREDKKDNKININQKSIDIKNFEHDNSLLKENLQLKIQEKKELENELEKLKLDNKQLNKLNKQGQNEFSKLKKNNVELQETLSDLQNVINKLKEENKSLKKDIKFWEENAEDTHPSYDEKRNKIKIKSIIKGESWTKEENNLLEKLYKKFIKNNNEKMINISRKIEDEFNKKGFNRNLNSIQRKIYRLNKK